jgi:hypothetical protein
MWVLHIIRFLPNIADTCTVRQANYSLCGSFHPGSKLVLACVMIRGRHRGLPIAIDRSILLPSDLDSFYSKSLPDSPPNEKGDFKSVPTTHKASHWSASTSSLPTDMPQVATNHAQGHVASSSNGILRTSGWTGSVTSPRSIKFA